MEVKTKDLSPIECFVVKIIDNLNFEHYPFETVKEAEEFIRNDSSSSEYTRVFTLDNSHTYGLLPGTAKFCEWMIVTADDMNVKLFMASV